MEVWGAFLAFLAFALAARRELAVLGQVGGVRHQAGDRLEALARLVIAGERGEQAHRVGVARAVENVLHRADLDDLAAVKHGDVTEYLFGQDYTEFTGQFLYEIRQFCRWLPADLEKALGPADKLDPSALTFRRIATQEQLAVGQIRLTGQTQFMNQTVPFSAVRYRGKIRAVGFQDNIFKRNIRSDLLQFSAVFKGHHAADPDVKTKLHIFPCKFNRP